MTGQQVSSFMGLEEACSEVDRLLAGRVGDITTPGSLLAAAYVHLAADHNIAMCLLGERGRFASMAALVRPFVEALARHYWFLYIATEANVERFHEGAEPPKVGKIVGSLELVRPDISRFLGGMWEEATALHDYAHGGHRQIARKFVREDQIGNGFSAEDIDGLAGLCRANILAVAISYAGQANDPEFTERLLRVVERHCGLPDGLSVEAHLAQIHPDR